MHRSLRTASEWFLFVNGRDTALGNAGLKNKNAYTKRKKVPFLFSPSLRVCMCVFAHMYAFVCVTHTHTHTHISALLLHRLSEKWHDLLFKFEIKITETKPVHVDKNRNSLLKQRSEEKMVRFLLLLFFWLSGAKTQWGQ